MQVLARAGKQSKAQEMVVQPVRVYSPDTIVRVGWPVLREMIGEQVASRELTWRLFVRDLSTKYKQSVLGFLWAFLNPVATVAVFVLLNRSGVLDIGRTSIPYPAYALLGITIWQLFATGLTAGAGSIVAGGSIVIKINFPKECLVLAAVGQSLVEFLIRLGLLAIVFIWYQIVPSWQTIFLPFVLFPLLALTLGLSLLLALLNVVIRDVEKSLGIVTTLLLFLTPVMYPVPSQGLLAQISYWNPLAPLVVGPRDLVITGQLPLSTSFVLVSLSSFAFLMFAWWLFHLAEKRIAERV
jgi:lipopolysaccharide transport system permease protein